MYVSITLKFRKCNDIYHYSNPGDLSASMNTDFDDQGTCEQTWCYYHEQERNLPQNHYQLLLFEDRMFCYTL